MNTYIQPKQTNYETDEEFCDAVKRIMEKYPSSRETLGKCLRFIEGADGELIDSSILSEILALFKEASEDSEEIMRISNFMIDSVEDFEEEICEKQVQHLMAFDKIFVSQVNN